MVKHSFKCGISPSCSSPASDCHWTIRLTLMRCPHYISNFQLVWKMIDLNLWLTTAIISNIVLTFKHFPSLLSATHNYYSSIIEMKTRHCRTNAEFGSTLLMARYFAFIDDHTSLSYYNTIGSLGHLMCFGRETLKHATLLSHLLTVLKGFFASIN